MALIILISWAVGIGLKLFGPPEPAPFFYFFAAIYFSTIHATVWAISLYAFRCWDWWRWRKLQKYLEGD